MTGFFRFENVSLRQDGQSAIAGTGYNAMNTVGHCVASQMAHCPSGDENVASDAGFWDVYMEASEVFARALKLGRLRGVVYIFSPIDHSENVKERRIMSMRLARDLIERDIMVILSGSSSAGKGLEEKKVADTVEFAGDGLTEFCENLGILPILEIGHGENLSCFQELCNLLADHIGVDVSLIPAVAIVQKWCPEKTNTAILSDTEGDDICTSDIDPSEVADFVDEYIHGKRLGMAWCDRYHCSIFS